MESPKIEWYSKTGSDEKFAQDNDIYAGTYTGRFNKSMAVVGNGSTILNNPQFKAGIISLKGISSVTGSAVIGPSAQVYTGVIFPTFTGARPQNNLSYSASSAGTTGWTLSSGYNTIRSNVAFIKFEASFSGTGATGYQDVVTGLPKPDRNWFFTFTDNSGNPVKVRVNTDGVLSVSNISSSSTLGIDTTITYPISG